jgi:hypothetical protein
LAWREFVAFRAIGCTGRMRFAGSACPGIGGQRAALRAGGLVDDHGEPGVFQFLLVSLVPAQELVAQAGDLE